MFVFYLFICTETYWSQGKLEHQRLKCFYVRTNKGKEFECQISRHQQCERLIRSIGLRVEKSSMPHFNVPTVPASEFEPLAATALEQHHHISSSRLFKSNLFTMVDENGGDSALKVSFFYL